MCPTNTGVASAPALDSTKGIAAILMNDATDIVHASSGVEQLLPSGQHITSSRARLKRIGGPYQRKTASATSRGLITRAPQPTELLARSITLTFTACYVTFWIKS